MNYIAGVTMNYIVETDTCQCYVIDDWLTLSEADTLLSQVLELPLQHNPTCVVFGKPCVMHRDMGFFSNTSVGYRFAKQLMVSQPLTPELVELLTTVNNKLNTDFNGLLINVYRNGKDYLGQHSDAEDALAKGSVVVGLSLGVSRIFRIVNKETKLKSDITTKHGQLLVMAGSFQKEYTHGIPERRKVEGLRASITFRKHLK